MPATLVLLSLAVTASSWKSDVLSDDSAVRAAAVSRLHARGRAGLYAVQDLASHAADVGERARAVRALGELGNADAEWALRTELKQPAPVAAEAIRAAVKLQLPHLRSLVLARVGDSDPALSAALGEASSVFPEVVDAAKRELSDPNPETALTGLRILSAAGVVLPQADAHRLLASSIPEASLIAAEALASVDPEAAEAALAKRAGEAGPLGDRAARSLARLGSSRALGNLEALARQTGMAERALGALGSCPQGLIHLLSLRARENALQSLIDGQLASHPPATADLRAVVASADDRTAQAAVALLARRQDGVVALEACLRALGPDAERCAAGLSAPLGVPVLRRALDSVDDKVRAMAAWACAASPEQACPDAMTSLVVDPSASVRTAAALGLGRQGAAGLPLLRTLVHDRVDSVRSAAAGQLAELLPEADLAALVRATLDDDSVRPQLLPALARLPADGAVTLLIEILGHGSAAERRQALEQLARFSDPRAYSALMGVAARDPDADARSFAAHVLGN